MKHKMLLASKNSGKLRELQVLLSDLPLEIATLAFDASEIAEAGATFLENAQIKARALWSKDMFILADDSGLCVDALGGAPGIYSARFANAAGTSAERDVANIQLLLQRLQAVPAAQRQAHFICQLVLKAPDGQEYACAGRVDGLILPEKRGEKGFGYDPVFYLPSLNKTMAELDLAEKNRLSHRAQALEKVKKVLVALLRENG